MRDTTVRVLIVHSDPADLAVLASVVAANSFELRVLEPGADVVGETRNYQPDSVVLDVRQRTSDGYALCRSLKSDPQTASVPVILTGSLDGPEARTRAFAVGCDDFLEKPINRQILAHRLRSFARLRRAWGATAHSEPLLAALCRFVRARDHARGRSDDRLHRMCERFGAALRLGPREQAALEQAALLHDIGEIGLPETIFAKAGPLTHAERSLVELHTEIGAELLHSLPDTELLASIVRHHHERFDGNGYPDQLAADEIPVLARVFRILDVFDAVTREQVYQRAHSRAEALAILRSEARDGSIDPSMLDVFERWLQQEPE